MKNLLRCCVLALPLVGCAAVFGEPPATETAMKRYYAAHATEDIGQCPSPYIDGFTSIQVVEDEPDRRVIDVRYLYRDWSRDQRSQDGMRSACVGYGERRFVLTKSDDTLNVQEMSGPKRGLPPAREAANG